MELTIDFDTLERIGLLGAHYEFPSDTCCDYIDSLWYKDGQFGVTVFVEPVGPITKLGHSWEETLDWWLAVFSLQPSDWDYIHAGWHLLKMATNGLPDDPSMVWQVPEGGRNDLVNSGTG